MSPTRLAALVLSALTLAVSGCGGSGATTTTATSGSAANSSATTSNATTGNAVTATTGTSTTSTPLSRTALTTTANAICKRLHAQLQRLSQGKTPSLDQIYSRAAAYEQTGLAKLRKLSPPADLATDWNQILTAVSTLVADSTKYAQASKAKNPGAASSVSESYDSIKRPAVAVAMRDGLTECGLAL